MSVDPEAVRAATLASADSVLARMDAWLAKSLREHPESEGDPLVLLDACIALLSEISFRIATSDDPAERRIRLAQHLESLETAERMAHNARLREREGIGTLSEDSRHLAGVMDRRLASLRMVARDWVDAERSTRDQRSAMSERRVIRDR